MKKIIASLLLVAGTASAQTYPIPQLPSVGSGDLFQDVQNGVPSVPSTYVSATTLGNYAATLPGNNAENTLIGGDFSLNLFQRGTSVVVASPANVTYTADRWFAWGGTNTPVTVSQSTDAPTNFLDSVKINKASGTGVKQVCFAQEVESANATRYQGLTAELSFHAKAGSGFSAANSNLAVYILTGTGTDEGSSNAAYSINTGGGSSTAWTGATVLGGTNGYLVPINTAWIRYTVAAPIPTGTTELAVAICYTPVGTGSSTDWFELAGVQLDPNSALTAAAGSSGAYIGAADPRAKVFVRRQFEAEVGLQQRYAYSISESGTTGALESAAGYYLTATTCTINFTFPVQMRVAPSYTNSLTASTFKIVPATTAVALSTPFSAQATGQASVNGSTLTFTTTTETQYTACELVSAAGGGQILWSAEL